MLCSSSLVAIIAVDASRQRREERSVVAGNFAESWRIAISNFLRLWRPIDWGTRRDDNLISMPKRALHDIEPDLEQRATKRARPNRPDRLSILSDELILRTLSFLPLRDLSLCERTSRRLKALARDGQLWKALYYDRFVKPRASRIPNIAAGAEAGAALHYSSKVSRWLEDDRLVRNGSTTDWKKQYKLRHNWSIGSAKVRETEVAERPSTPPLLLRMHEDVLVMADQEHGLRAWTLGKEPRLLASHLWVSEIEAASAAPTALAVDSNASSAVKVPIIVGFSNGSFSLFGLDKTIGSMEHRYTHAASSAGELSAVSYSSPFLLTATPEPRLSLYSFIIDTSLSQSVQPPRLLSSLRSHTVYSPIALNLRKSASSLMASIAFAMQNNLPRWFVGIQELRLDHEGTVVDSRVSFPTSPQSGPIPSSPWADMLSILPLPSSRPASISYNHPYLLTAHPDNTLTLYMVTSNDASLEISAGTVLWGHTSAISVAQIGDRGKAVSVSQRGNELRVWELEGRGRIPGSRKEPPIAHRLSSVRVVAELNDSEERKAHTPHDRKTRAHSPIISSAHLKTPISQDSSVFGGTVNGITKGWMAFDEEKVVLLREKLGGQQAVVVYDFT